MCSSDLIRIGSSLPTFLHLLRKSDASVITRRALVNHLSPSFAEEGSNACRFQRSVYALFMKYVREAGSGQRLQGNITLTSILEFVTCFDEEPVFGFDPHPQIFLWKQKVQLSGHLYQLPTHVHIS